MVMIHDDLRLQDKILVYLYEHINKVSNTFELEAGIEDATFEDINRQLYVLARKELLTFSKTPSLSGNLTETMYVQIMKNGCTRAEKLLQKQQVDEKKARSWSF